MDHVLALERLVRLAVRGVLESHPAVAGLRERPHHPAVEVARGQLALVAAGALGLDVQALELVAVGVDQLGHHLRVEQRPHFVVLDAAHEQIGDPVGDVQVVGAPRLVAGVVAQLQEVLDVGVPRFDVDARRALSLPALVDGGDRRVERLQPRHDAVGGAVGPADERPLRADSREGDADAAGVLGQLGDVGVAVVDGLEVVLGRVEQVAGGHLGMPRAGVEQGRGARHVVETRHEVVEVDCLTGRLGKPARHAQEEVLRRLD